MAEPMPQAEVCTICTEELEWVAFGPCLHRTICSTCAVRVRSISGNLRCQICRANCDFIFVTRAQGDLASRNNDFPSFPSNPKEGIVRDWWYNEDSKAFFLDCNEYKRIRALCRPSCTLCVKTNFNCIGELMTHLFETHQLYMCTVCLVWRMEFISEQLLFTRAQLNQHIRTGDSEVDESLIEMKSFKGHAKCELCTNPFYGDNKIFIHMHTLICPCHICDGLRPGSRTSHLEDHFCQHIHIGPEDSYWQSKFSIVRAFADETVLERHMSNCHDGQTRPLQYGWRSWRGV